MKSTKSIIRIWIATTSVVGFLGAWGFISHAPKPAPLNLQTNTPITTQVPSIQLPSINQPQSLPGIQSLPSFQPQQSPFSRLRTRGS
jgi:hypothetical protein